MTESKIKDRNLDCKKIESEILRYLESQGSIKAALVFKLEKYFCSQDFGFNVERNKLHHCLFNMLLNRRIEIIIPELFRERFRPQKFENLEYLKDGLYFTRRYKKIRSKDLKNYNQNEYYLDTRKLEHRLIENWIDHLKVLLCKKNMNKKVIIFNPVNSHPINIYEDDFECNYHLSNFSFSIFKKMKHKKLEIPLESQVREVAIIQAYRKHHACFYIPLISSILKTIEYTQAHKNQVKDYEKTMQKYALKFTAACIDFVRSDYIDIMSNPLKWESFINYFKIPIKILVYDFKNIKFHGRTWENYQILKLCIYINKKYTQEINRLKNLGYKEFTDQNTNDSISIGLNLKIYYPCSTIEHIYFLSKYICFYCVFLLFSHSFDYIKKFNIIIKDREKNIFENFLPVINSLFNIEFRNRIPQKVIFKYYTYNSDELEVIYNHFLINAVKDIEKKMYKYFRFRCSFV
jgi:hypothetical protein